MRVTGRHARQQTSVWLLSVDGKYSMGLADQKAKDHLPMASPGRGSEGTGFTCTRVRMTSMGLVRMEAVAAARGPEMA